METLHSIVIAIMGNVAAYYIVKWLDWLITLIRGNQPQSGVAANTQEKHVGGSQSTNVLFVCCLMDKRLFTAFAYG